MNERSNSEVAIIFDDVTEFFVMQRAILDARKKNIKIDIIVPYDSAYGELPRHTKKTIEDAGFEVFDDAPKNKHYKILLTPYPGINVVERLEFDYHIKYNYGAAIAKPDPVYNPNQKIQYDAMIFFNNRDAELLSAYGAETFVCPYWRYEGFKKKPHGGKKNLLILPTFGDVSCIKLLKKECIKDLSKEYRIIIKAHHATEFMESEKDDNSSIKKLADEYYGSDKKLDDLLAEADVVLSDNSGAIFEALYVRVPVALLSGNTDMRQFRGVHSLQSILVNKGVFPTAKNASQLYSVIEKAQTEDIIKLQNIARENLFRLNENNSFVEIIKKFLSREAGQDDRHKLHLSMVKDWEEAKKKNEIMNSEIAELRKQIQDFRESTSWKITGPLRKIRSIIKK